MPAFCNWTRVLRAFLVLCALIPSLASASVCVTCGGGGSGGGTPPPAGDARTLWVAMPENVLKLSAKDGSPGLELDETPVPQGFAIDQTAENLWVYGHKTLQGFDSKGNLLVNVRLTHDFDDDTPAGMAVDNGAGDLWLAIHRRLYRLDLAGNVLATIRLSEEAEGISLDAKQSQLWVAEEQGIEIFDGSGKRLNALSLGHRFHPEAVAYDAYLKQAWLLSDENLERVDASGTVALQVRLADGLDKFLAPDGQGGLWVAGQRRLARLDQSGTAQFIVEPFATADPHHGRDDEDDDEGEHQRIVDLVADPLDHSAWTADSTTLKHFGSDSSLKLTVAVPAPTKDPDASTGEHHGAGHENDEDHGDEDHHDGDHGDDDHHHRVDVRRLALYVDTIPPTVSISAPPNFIHTNNDRPALTLSYSDIGSGVDPASVVLTANGAPTPITCQASSDGTGATCIPNLALADGGYTFTVTVKDYAGNVSQPASVILTIDTVPPTITITSAAVTNVPAYTLTGSLSEAGNFSVNGTPAPLDSSNSFSLPLTLTAGPNNLDLLAIDLAGNVTEQTAVITYNATPVNTPAGALVAFAPGGGATQTLICQPGAASAGTTVVLTDINSGRSASGTVNGGGACSVPIAGAGSDNYSLALTTPSGQNQTVYLHGNDAPLQFQVTSPVTGTTVNGSIVSVTGTYTGPANMGITVNGEPAVLVDGQFSVNGVALAPGANNLTVTATSVGGVTASQTLTVTSAAPSQLFVTATPTETGQSPLSVTFQYSYSGTTPIQTLEMSYLGNGSNDVVSSDPTTALSYTYAAPGIYPATLTLIDINGVQYQAVVNVTVQDAVQDTAQVDTAIRSTWSDMITALSSGNKAAAINMLDYTARQKFEPVFNALLPNMRNIVNGFSPLLQSSISSDNAEYAIRRTDSGQDSLFFVYFIQDQDGVWRLDEM